jgi:hypothetical protein
MLLFPISVRPISIAHLARLTRTAPLVLASAARSLSLIQLLKLLVGLSLL